MIASSRFRVRTLVVCAFFASSCNHPDSFGRTCSTDADCDGGLPCTLVDDTWRSCTKTCVEDDDCPSSFCWGFIDKPGTCKEGLRRRTAR